MYGNRLLKVWSWCLAIAMAIAAHTARAQCPQIFIAPAALSNATQGTPYSVTFSATGGTPPYSFAVDTSSVLPPGLSLTPGGILNGTPTTSGSFQFGIVVSDSSCRTTWNMTLNVSATAPPPCPQITIAPSLLSNATQGTPYSVTFSATGGTPPYSFALGSGSLPPGMSFAGGVLSGTPTASGTFQFAIVVTDSIGCSTTWNMTLNVSATAPPPCPQITIAPSFLSNATQGTPYSVTFSATGGTPPYSFAVDTSSVLPAGLSLTPGGVLSGTPTTSGSFQFGIVVSDSASCRTTWNMTLNVAAAPPPPCPQ